MPAHVDRQQGGDMATFTTTGAELEHTACAALAHARMGVNTSVRAACRCILARVHVIPLLCFMHKLILSQYTHCAHGCMHASPPICEAVQPTTQRPLLLAWDLPLSLPFHEQPSSTPLGFIVWR